VRAAGQLHVVISGGAYTSLPLSIPNNTRITVGDQSAGCRFQAACSICSLSGLTNNELNRVSSRQDDCRW
jgi:hypothetical protein